MGDLFLLMVMAIAFVCGYFAVKKLDRFLENNSRAAVSHPQSGEDSIRIGFSDPLVADSIAEVLDALTKSQQNVSVCLFGGAEKELLRKFSIRKLDAVFLPENVAVPEKTHYNVVKVSLGCTPVTTKYSGLAIEPIAEGHPSQNVLWEDGEKAPMIRYLIRCLQKERDGED